MAGLCLLVKKSNTIGVIAKEWGEWIPALAFVPITATWVWVLDNKWRLVLQRAYPSLIFIDGFSLPLPAVDIILLSRVTLRQYKISLQYCPASLILSTARLRVASGWVSKYWRIKHSHTGGCTYGCWTLYSLHRVQFVSVPDLDCSLALPPENIRRVVNPCASGVVLYHFPQLRICLVWIHCILYRINLLQSRCRQCSRSLVGVLGV